MDDCVFCKIIKGEIPSTLLYEDNDFFVFLDIAPIQKGHTLIVPKKHSTDIFDFKSNLGDKLISIIQKTGKAVMRGVNADGFNFGLNNGVAAGQVIMHTHFHIVPRFDNDGLKSWPDKKYKEGEMEKVGKNIIKYL